MLAFYLSFLETEEEKNKFIRLYEEYRNLMLNTASRKIKDPYAAEDAVHEAFPRSYYRECCNGYAAKRNALPYRQL